MLSLTNKRILLGITGGISAYKCAELVRLFIQAGSEVRVAMTNAAQEFITPLTLQALSGNHVFTSLVDVEAEAAMGHIELARWADIILIAPTTADFMAKITRGEANDIVSTLVLATQAPIAIAPAMNQVMWSSTATQKNLSEIFQIPRKRTENVVADVLHQNFQNRLFGLLARHRPRQSYYVAFGQPGLV